MTDGDETRDRSPWKGRMAITVTLLVVIVFAVAFHGSAGVQPPPPVRGTSNRLSAVSRLHVPTGLSAGATRVMEEAQAEVAAEVAQEAGMPVQHAPLLTIFLQGEPKSGTTWMELVVNDMISKYKNIGLCQECSFEGIVGDNDHVLHGANVLLDGTLYQDLDFNRKFKHLLPIANDDFVHLKGAQPSKILPGGYADCMNFYETNAWDASKPCPFLEPPAYREDFRYVVIVRDPRALIVSGAHYFKKNLASYLAKSGKGIIQRVAFRYHWFTKVVDPRSCIVLHYHNVKDNPLFEYQRIAHFMGLPLSKTHLSEVLNMTTVEAMHSMEEHKELPHKNAAGTETAKVRSGTTDEWREEITGESLKAINQLMVNYLPEELRDEFLSEEDLTGLDLNGSPVIMVDGKSGKRNKRSSSSSSRRSRRRHR